MHFSLPEPPQCGDEGRRRDDAQYRTPKPHLSQKQKDKLAKTATDNARRYLWIGNTSVSLFQLRQVVVRPAPADKTTKCAPLNTQTQCNKTKSQRTRMVPGSRVAQKGEGAYLPIPNANVTSPILSGSYP